MTVSGSNTTYLGVVSGGGFSSESTLIDIATPCISSKSYLFDFCFDHLTAVMGWNITADNWLINQTPNVTGTLGMGIESPFWFQTNETFA